MGSRTAQYYSNLYGNNDVFVNAGLSDAFTNAANKIMMVMKVFISLLLLLHQQHQMFLVNMKLNKLVLGTGGILLLMIQLGD